MKRFIPLVIAILLVAVAPSYSGMAYGQSAGLVSSVLNRMERNRQSLKSLRAAISMEKYNAQLRDSEKYNGTVAYLPSTGRQAAVRIEWSSPQHEILAVLNGKYTLCRPRLNMCYVGSSSKSESGKARGILEMMYMSKQQLEAKFQPVQDVREETLWGGISTIHLTLVPKGNASFRYAEIWVDSSGMPVQTKIVEKNDDATTMRLTGMEKNAKIPGDEFNLKLDPSVRIVKS
ncbi:MAG: outer membrane lipoprotein carrier protein LolA [Pyrinomonadaceae bacterium]|nr:outer membrane lipoprotein carrier protein LolA [Pyrinomonadaceae bacterium]